MVGYTATQMNKLSRKHRCDGAFEEPPCENCSDRDRCELLNLTYESNRIGEGMKYDDMNRIVILTRKLDNPKLYWRHKSKPDKSKLKRKICRCKK
jgi:hypothetical protein